MVEMSGTAVESTAYSLSMLPHIDRRAVSQSCAMSLGGGGWRVRGREGKREGGRVRGREGKREGE